MTARPTRPAEALARLAAGAAHELNNPLSVMVGYLSLISSGRTPDAKLPEQLQLVTEEAQRCRLVVRGLTELAESTSADPEQLDLHSLLVDALAGLGERPPLVVSIVGLSRAPVLGQPRGLTRLVAHGIENAVEASARSLALKLTRAGDVTRLELRDDGQGMSEAVLARAREPFFSTKPSQLGLGLAICDAVAWAHGGSVGLSSRAGVGTSLTLALPDEGARRGAS